MSLLLAACEVPVPALAGGSADPPAGETEDPAADRDAFGLEMRYPSSPGGLSWTSEHWSNGEQRTLTGAGDVDPGDPSGWSSLQGSGATRAMEIDGDGTMALFGNQPRIYIDPGADGFTNVEVTFFYRRGEDDSTAWGGAVVGMRSGPEGHSSDPCDAHTYYARLRHDGYHDFEKELEHPASATRDRTQVYPDALPAGEWIGVKAVVYTRADGSVVLEHYRDTTDGVDGGAWEPLGTQVIDSGGWAAEQSADCGRPDDYVITDGGVVLVRNTMGDGGRADYRWFSVREIIPPE
jgi:hypothetical protein